MKVGDLVRMKRRRFWDLKGNHRLQYTEEPLLVLECAHWAVNVLYPDGNVRSDLAEGLEVISESRHTTLGHVHETVPAHNL